MDLQPCSNSQEEMNLNGNTTTAAADDKKHLRPQPDRTEKCPRCDSGNTKFCYYNNYSLSQPRYFCKACRRYWTKGGTLRNVPVGGGCRKNRRSAKRAFDNHNDHLLVENHHQMETNNNNTNNRNDMLCSAAFGPKSNQSSPSLADNSNFSSTLRYEDSGTCDGLSLAFATIQRQSNVQHLGFELGSENFILGHQPITTSTNDLGFFNNFFEPETTKSLNSKSLYNYGAQPLPLSNEDLSLSNMSSKGLNEINGDVNGNRILLGLPWQVDSSSNNVVGQGSLEQSNSTNVVFGFGTGSNNYNNDGCYEVEGGGGGRSDRWNNNNINTGLVASAGSSWPNLININSTA